MNLHGNTTAKELTVKGIIENLLNQPECDVPVPGIFHFLGGIGTGIGKKWYRKKVSEPVSEKFGTGKSPRTGIGKI